ncbi:MMPL family transporter [Bacillus sp. LLTC93]|uniref:MMPL family transporter n=1 Tax=Bacillus sp. LLTC93 TaxID=2108274 RepID=UPI000D01A3B1|nr:MMPL family transporter [Bacillus sp. LLTC93]PRO41636.1 MMPL family transporter [Bacillus sp. LLTC93]
MKRLNRFRIASLILWITVSIISIITMPNIDELVREKGQIEIPPEAQSELAKEMINKIDQNKSDSYQMIAIFNSGSKQALTKAQNKEIEKTVRNVKSNIKDLGITEIISHLDNEDTRKQLVSKDKTTILMTIWVDKNQGTITEVENKLNSLIDKKDTKTYLTGSDLVLNDFLDSTQKGVKKTEVIAIIFIIAVLMVVFRSPIVPLISLLTVGVAYLVSMGIVANLVDVFNYPFSNFTQVFLIVILFGIGTDYNILIYTRFKEELSANEDILLAIKSTFKSAGKTVLYSGFAVLIGFITLILAEFKLYQSSSAVAIGIGILLLVLMTLNPVFMILLGKKMFWPSKHFEEHGNSRVWGFLSKHSVARPIVALIFIMILCVPSFLHDNGKLNYNDLLEINDSYQSKKGINTIEEHFSPGFSSPTTLAIQSDEKMDDQSSLQALDELIEAVSKIEGVAEVYGPTRPAGKKIKDLYIKDQSEDLTKGLEKTNDGVNDINNGLINAENDLDKRNTSDLDNVQKLIDGTSSVKDGVNKLEGALNQLTGGMESGTASAAEIEEGLVIVSKNLHQLSKATSQLNTSYSKLEEGLSSFSDNFQHLDQGIKGAKQGYEQIEISMENLIQSRPDLASDPNVKQTLGIARSGKEQLALLLEKLEKSTPQYNSAMSSFSEANTSLAKVNEGIKKTETGVNKLKKGSSQLRNGLKEGTSGSRIILNNTSKMKSGLTEINNGQKDLLTGLNKLEDKIEKLQSGLSKSTEGLDEVSSGLNEAQTHLSGLSQSKAAETFYIPQNVLKSDEYQKVLDQYMGNDRKTAQMTIILDVNPYSQEAMSIIEKIHSQVNTSISKMKLNDVKTALGGKSSQNLDLKEVSSKDFMRTALLMIIGIGLILILITRSFWQPIFIIFSLLLAYKTSLGISQWISQYMIGIDELSWNVPFFSFIMIVALGVDYSIFLMMRYRELEPHSLSSIVGAARSIGGVVLSAAVILGGTFAALIPSGIITLIQVAIVVIIGLILLSLIMMPIFIPSLMAITHKIKFRKES